MKYVSDLTGEMYDTVKACEEADKEYEKKVAAQKAAEEAARVEYEKRTEELKKAEEKMNKAKERYEELAVAYNEDYGCACKHKKGYHTENGDTHEMTEEEIDEFIKDIVDLLPFRFR